MKRITYIYKTMLVLLWLVIGLPLIAVETGQVNYQARLLDSFGRRVNGTVDLSFKIYDAVTNGDLLWSETQSGVVVQDGVYAVVLGSQTPVPASVFAQNTVYLELGINGETMTPRQQITASAYSLVARTIMGSNVYENQTSGYLGVGTTNPAVKLDVNGMVQSTGFKMSTGATAGYILVTDGNGVGTWQALSVVLNEHDPVFTNWVEVTFAPATNSIWGAINARALVSDVATATNDIWTAVNARVLAATYSAATGDLWTAANARVLRSGDIMTGPLTNFAGFVGNGAGLTNVPSGGVILTGYVQRVGDTMTGPLIVSNYVTITGTNQVGSLYVTNAIILQDAAAITNWLGLTNNAVLGAVYARRDVGVTNIAASAVTNTQIANGAVIEAKIADGAVTANKIGPSAVTLGKIANNAVADSNIISAAVTLGKIANNAVADSNIIDGAVTSGKIGPSAVTLGKIDNLAVAESNIAALAVTSGKIGPSAVTLGKIDNSAVDGSNIVNLAVTSGKIGPSAVTIGKIDNLAVASSNIAPSAVTLGKIDNRAVADSNLVSAVTWNNAVVIKQGGGAIAYSNLYYFASDGAWTAANASTNTTAQGLLGIALGDSVASSGLMLNGSFSNCWGFDSIGAVIYMGTSAGTVTTNRPAGTNNIVRILGYVVSTTNIYFNPDRTYIEILGD